MKCHFLPLALAVMIAAGMCGCDNDPAPESRKALMDYENAATRRYFQRCSDRMTTLQSQVDQAIALAEGWKKLYERDYVVTVVVTNTVYVTNECTRQHWPDVIDPGMGKDAYQLELTVNPGTNYLNGDEVAKRLCELRGHTWQSGCGMMGCLVIHGGPVRHCTVCGKTETQTVGEWK